MSEEKSVVKYQSKDGQEITLSPDTVKKFLVSGHGDKVTNQELMYFMATCKSRGLNPFKRDAYIIKYNDDPAAIVTSIDYFRARARAQADCVGWKKGVILQRPDGTVRDSAGLVLDGEKLVGGFFEAQPAKWTSPFRIEVNLKAYIKKTRDGKITRFWQEDNQPTMIAKVAEAQGLRTLWPDEFQGLYEEGEIRPETVELMKGENGAYSHKEPLDVSAFNDWVGENISTDRLVFVDQFLAASAKALKRPVDEVKAMAQEDLASFQTQFNAWVDKLTAPKTDKPKPEPPPQKLDDMKDKYVEEWNPLNAEVQERYPVEKRNALAACAAKMGVNITGLKPKEAHERLLSENARAKREIAAAVSKDDDEALMRELEQANHLFLKRKETDEKTWKQAVENASVNPIGLADLEEADQFETCWNELMEN